MTPDEARQLRDGLSETDAPPWTEIGPQEHGESDVETVGFRYGPMPRTTAEMMAAAPDMADTLANMREEWMLEYEHSVEDVWETVRTNFWREDYARNHIERVSGNPKIRNISLRRRLVSGWKSVPDEDQ